MNIEQLKVANESFVYSGEIIDWGQSQYYFRFDVFPEATAKDNWSVYCQIQDDLRECGWQLDNSYTDHDSVTGYLKKLLDCGSVVERFLDMEKVVGPIPTSPTILE